MLKIGHRGVPLLEPENTLRSFKKAISLGMDMIEFDVHLCKSGELIVIHDKKVNRTTNGRGLVKNKTLQELKKLNAGKGEKIPTLKQVLDLVDKKIMVNIELIGKGTAEPALKIINEYINKKNWKNSHFLVSSFRKRELKKIYKLNQRIRLGALSIRGVKDCLRLAKKIEAYSIHLSVKQTKKRLVERIKNKGFKIMVYTIKKSNDAKKIKSLPINGIFINSPEFL